MISISKWMFGFLLAPMNLFWVLIVFSFLFRNINKKASRNALYASVFWLFITSTNWIPNLLVFHLEKQYNVLIPDTTVQDLPIMVLGGGNTNDLDIPAHERLSGSALARLTEGIRLWHKLSPPFLVFSGYSSSTSTTQAMITKLAAVELGVCSESIKILEKPSTTEEEAIAYKAVFGKQYPRFILVTSDIHMPRAVYLFQKHGLNPIPAPSDHILKKRYFCKSKKVNNLDSLKTTTMNVSSFNSNGGNFTKFSAAMHEYIGLYWAKMR